MSTPTNPVKLTDGHTITRDGDNYAIRHPDKATLIVPQGQFSVLMFEALVAQAKLIKELEQENADSKEALETALNWNQAYREAHEGMRQCWLKARKKTEAMHRRAQKAEGWAARWEWVIAYCKRNMHTVPCNAIQHDWFDRHFAQHGRDAVEITSLKARLVELEKGYIPSSFMSDEHFPPEPYYT